MRVYFFGCWNEPGHYLHTPGGYSPHDPRVAEYGAGIRVDGSLAPRLVKRAYKLRNGTWLLRGDLCWTGQGADSAEAYEIEYISDEYPQGQYLLHHLPNGFTALSWWDRCQGDRRDGSNSTILLEGQHDASAMLAALAEHFPHVMVNLLSAGVVLVDARRAGPAEVRG